MTTSILAQVSIAAVLLAVAPTVLAVEKSPECPAQLSPASIHVQSAGWTPYVQYPLYLASAGMSAGPPESLAVLRGEQLNQKGQASSTRYVFGDIGMEQGRWLDCGYGRDSAITLSRRLDDRIKECVVTYLKRSRDGRQGITIQCK